MLRERMGEGTTTVELPDGATVRDLTRALETLRPDLRIYWQTVRWARADRYLDETSSLEDGEELYAIPPVSGGF